MINKYGKLPIDYALRHNYTQIAKLLINKNNINDMDKNGRTSLNKAVQKGNIELVQFLVDNGARVDVRDKNGNDVIHYAKKSSFVEITKILSNAKKSDCLVM